MTATSTANLATIDVLSNLMPWAGNPRGQRNPCYSEIAVDIRANGFKGILAVTQPPNDHIYVPRFGGNTRVEILRELAEEGALTEITAEIYPWPGEAIMLRDAITENIHRGAQDLLDEAIAIARLLELNAGNDLRQQSTRRMAERLTALGLRYSRQKCQQLAFLSGRLLPAVGEASLRAMNDKQGPSLADTKSVMTLIREYLQLWQEQELGSESGYEQLVERCLSDVSSPFTVLKFHKTLSLEVGKLLKGDRADTVLPLSPQSPETGMKTRRDLVALVASVTSSMELGDCVIVDEQDRLGFRLTLPESPIDSQSAQLWWLLCGLTQQLADVRGGVFDHDVLQQLLHRGDVESVFRVVGKPPAIHRFCADIIDLKCVARIMTLAAALSKRPGA